MNNIRKPIESFTQENAELVMFNLKEVRQLEHDYEKATNIITEMLVSAERQYCDLGGPDWRKQFYDKHVNVIQFLKFKTGHTYKEYRG